MSRIGTLEHLNVAAIFQRVEAYAKTGLLVVKREVQWTEIRLPDGKVMSINTAESQPQTLQGALFSIESSQPGMYTKGAVISTKQHGENREFYFRDGRLVCIGSADETRTLGDRLLQSSIISSRMLQEIKQTIGMTQPTETSLALMLMDLGYLSYKNLYTWAASEAAQIVHTLLAWPSGEIHFKEGLQPPEDRLLVALSITSLLPSSPLVPTPKPAHTAAPSTDDIPTEYISAVTMMSPQESLISSLRTPDNGRNRTRNLPDDSGLAHGLSQPMRITNPILPKHINTSFMRQEMVLTPTNLTALRQQNPRVSITPEQWRLLTRADGHTSLQAACHELAMSSEQICRIAGELIVQGLAHISMPLSNKVDALSQVANGQITSAVGRSHVTPGNTDATPQPWVTFAPTTEALNLQFLRSSSTRIPAVMTHSQWGNGDNSASFVPGYGWVSVASHTSGPLPRQAQHVYRQSQQSGPLSIANNLHTQAGSTH